MRKLGISAVSIAFALAGSIAAGSALALDIDSAKSSISLVSTKVLADGTSSAAEIFSFNSLSGNVDENGEATVIIDLGAIETGIGIRNERMGEFFFETDSYPEATITAQVPDSVMEQGTHMIDLEVKVDMHGSQMMYTVPAMVTSGDEGVTVVTSKPLLVDASSFELQSGLERLRELAGLMHIPATVPVTFILAFTR